MVESVSRAGVQRVEAGLSRGVKKRKAAIDLPAPRSPRAVMLIAAADDAVLME